MNVFYSRVLSVLRQCLKQYVELLIKEGLQTDISCPDSACPQQGRLQENEVLAPSHSPLEYLIVVLQPEIKKNIIVFALCGVYLDIITTVLEHSVFYISGLGYLCIIRRVVLYVSVSEC